MPLGIASTGNGGYYLAGQDIPPNSLFGIRYYNASAPLRRSPLSIGLSDRNDYDRVQVFNGALWFMQLNASFVSAMYRIGSLPNLQTAPAVKPAAPLFAGPTMDWTDFALASDSLVYVGATSGLYVWAADAGGVWSVTAVAGSPRDIISVGLSNDAATLYAVVANNTVSGLYAYSTASGSWVNGGAPILLPPTGRQFRGVGEFLPAPLIHVPC